MVWRYYVTVILCVVAVLSWKIVLIPTAMSTMCGRAKSAQLNNSNNWRCQAYCATRDCVHIISWKRLVKSGLYTTRPCCGVYVSSSNYPYATAQQLLQDWPQKILWLDGRKPFANFMDVGFYYGQEVSLSWEDPDHIWYKAAVSGNPHTKK